MNLNKSQAYYFLFFLCIASRIITSIYYIEDIDSLRFALSISDYNILKLQPHFPGYPVFCFIAKIIYVFTNNLGITFSIIGGVSGYFINYFILKLCKIELLSPSGLFCSLIIFFNPLLWILSNRYMPDLMGLSLMVSIIYYLTIKNSNIKQLVIGFVLIGILAGTRLSYLPVVFIPALLHIIDHKKRVYFILSFIIGCLLWLIPLIWISGFNNLYLVAEKQTVGHFYDYGGTVFTDDNWFDRFENLFRSVWADGLGGYWVGRSWLTLILSLPLGYLLYCGYHSIRFYFINDRKWRLIIYSMIVYLIWILLFQNIIYKSRHILPILIFLLSFISLGDKQILYNHFLTRFLMVIFFVSLISVSSILVIQHKKPAAVSKLKEAIVKDSDLDIIVSIPLINYYLKTHNVDAHYISIENPDELKYLDNINLSNVLVIGEYPTIFPNNYRINMGTIFFHNPYVNRMWSSIKTFRLEKK